MQRFYLLLLGCLLPGAAVAADRPAPPNIILMMADDFGYECVGCNGGASYRTPRLDALAAGGVRFTHAYATPLCTPTRVQLMTGRYNFRNYVRFGEFDFKERTFAHVLKDAGYATCIAGKWQLSGGLDGPRTAGFDDYCLWQIFSANKGSRYANPKVHRNGELLGGLEKGYGPDVFLEHVNGFITRHKDRPFFVYWPMVLTHDPFEPTPDSKQKSPSGDVKNFPDMVAYLDRNVGKLVDHLEKQGLREKTLILFVGDNGTSKRIRSRLGDREIQGGKGSTTTAGTHVPLIASGPGVVKGKVSDDLIDFTDVLPTLADAAGAPLPKGVTLDGRSFLPQLRGDKGTPREWIFCHYEPRHGNNQVKTRYAQDQRWKLYQDGRLFDVKADEEEKQPVKQGTESADARRRLQDVLDRMEKEKPFGK